MISLRTMTLLAVIAGHDLVLPRPTVAAVDSSATVGPQVTEDDVQKLIQQLGAKEFAARERAQAELSELKLIAFETLEEVRNHEDFEIRVRVRRLLDSVRGPLMLDVSVKGLEDLLAGYTELDEEQRAEKIETLGTIEPVDALPILTRFARFEESRALAKRAALKAMQLDYPPEPALREQLAEQIRELSGLSKRTSIHWLRTFADSLNGPEKQLAAWQEIQDQPASQQLPPDILRELSQVHMDVLVRAGQKESALNLAKEIVAMGVDGRQDLADLSDWLIKRGLFELFDQIYAANRDEFEADRSLLYRRAEAELRRGEAEAAEQLAERAFGIEPDEKDLAKGYWIWQSLQNDGAIHATVASELRDRGLFPWAEREFREALKEKSPPYYVYIKSHVWLSEMLHDQQDDQRAASVLKSLVDASQNDQKLQNGFPAWEQSLDAITSRMYFFQACHHEQRSEIQEQMAALRKGIEASPTDADVLIAMHRVKDPSEEWQRETHALIRDASIQANQSIRMARANWEAGNVRDARSRLAQKLNDYAWLVGNTEGDAQRALRFSQESLQLEPGTPGYLDTLGRCYYRLGDYENAVRYQRQAVRRDPHSGQLLRQLELFESALANEVKTNQ